MLFVFIFAQSQQFQYFVPICRFGEWAFFCTNFGFNVLFIGRTIE